MIMMGKRRQKGGERERQREEGKHGGGRNKMQERE